MLCFWRMHQKKWLRNLTTEPMVETNWLDQKNAAIFCEIPIIAKNVDDLAHSSKKNVLISTHRHVFQFKLAFQRKWLINSRFCYLMALI
jgi:hypothetical protein